MAGVVLLYVGAVLSLNGLWILGYIQDKEIAVINIFSGTIAFLAAIFSIFQNTPQTIEFGAYVLLFAFTYLWVAINRFSGADGRGLGWYCLFVAITAIPVALTILSGAEGKVWSIWLGLNWLAWAVLWFLYFLLLALQKPIGKLTGWITLLQGIVTAWIPGYLLLTGRLVP
jgi:hypothetical protein